MGREFHSFIYEGNVSLVRSVCDSRLYAVHASYGGIEEQEERWGRSIGHFVTSTKEELCLCSYCWSVKVVPV